MRTRLTLGPLLIFATVAVFAVDQWLAAIPGTILTGVALVLATLASREIATIGRTKGVPVSPMALAMAAALGVLALPWLAPIAGDTPAIVAYAAIVVLVIGLAPNLVARRPAGASAAAGLALVCFAHIGLSLGFLIDLRQETSAWFLLGIIVMTKACDTFAYFTGTAIGRHKLIPWLSPGKTWEGLAGGIAGSCLVAAALWWILPETASLNAWLILPTGILIACTGQAGDLLVSLYKRDAGLKDSGETLPGFGGILDILDSPLLVGPMAHVWFTVVLGS